MLSQTGWQADLQSLWHSGMIMNAVIALTLIEMLFLWVYHRLSGKGPAPQDVLLNLISGLCLMLAVRSALLYPAWNMTVLWLSASGLAHGADLKRRWHRQRRIITPS